MKKKAFRLFWVVILVIGSFTLGYTLKPKGGKRTMPPIMMGKAMGRFTMPADRKAPPLNFRR